MRRSNRRFFNISAALLVSVLVVQQGRCESVSERWGEKVSPEESSQARHFSPTQTANHTANLFKHFGKGLVDLLKFKQPDHLSEAAYEFVESIINPVELVNAVISDDGALLKSPEYLGRRTSHRVRVCTGLLGMIEDAGPKVGWQAKWPMDALIAPVEHVGVLVDGTEDFSNGGGGLSRLQTVDGITCSDVPIISDEPEAIVIERLEYVGWRYAPEYSFLERNCAYYTRDVLSASGFAYPIFPNAGIGAEYPLTRHPKTYGAIRAENLKMLTSLKSESEDHVAALRNMFNQLENGEVPSSVEIAFGSDAFFQTIASATRSRNAQAQKAVIAAYGAEKNEVIVGHLMMKVMERPAALKNADYRKKIEEIFNGLSRQDVQWYLGSPDADPYEVQHLEKIFDVLEAHG